MNINQSLSYNDIFSIFQSTIGSNVDVLMRIFSFSLFLHSTFIHSSGLTFGFYFECFHTKKGTQKQTTRTSAINAEDDNKRNMAKADPKQKINSNIIVS